MSKQDRLEEYINAIITNGKLADVAVGYGMKLEGFLHRNVGLYWNMGESTKATLDGPDRRVKLMLTPLQMNLYITTKNEHLRNRVLDKALSIFEDVDG